MSTPTIEIVALTPPKVGQVFETQKSKHLALCLRVDVKQNENLSVQYVRIDNLKKEFNSGDLVYTEWTTWYQKPKYDTPLWKGVIDWSHYPNLVNDTQECECYECGNYYEVEGLRDQVEENIDRFNGSHYQTSSYYRTFDSVWQCPNCKTMNFEERADEIE